MANFSAADIGDFYPQESDEEREARLRAEAERAAGGSRSQAAMRRDIAAGANPTGTADGVYDLTHMSPDGAELPYGPQHADSEANFGGALPYGMVRQPDGSIADPGAERGDDDAPLPTRNMRRASGGRPMQPPRPPGPMPAAGRMIAGEPTGAVSEADRVTRERRRRAEQYIQRLVGDQGEARRRAQAQREYRGELGGLRGAAIALFSPDDPQYLDRARGQADSRADAQDARAAAFGQQASRVRDGIGELDSATAAGTASTARYREQLRALGVPANVAANAEPGDSLMGSIVEAQRRTQDLARRDQERLQDHERGLERIQAQQEGRVGNLRDQPASDERLSAAVATLVEMGASEDEARAMTSGATLRDVQSITENPFEWMRTQRRRGGGRGGNRASAEGLATQRETLAADIASRQGIDIDAARLQVSAMSPRELSALYGRRMGRAAGVTGGGRGGASQVSAEPGHILDGITGDPSIDAIEIRQTRARIGEAHKALQNLNRVRGIARAAGLAGTASPAVRARASAEMLDMLHTAATIAGSGVLNEGEAQRYMGIMPNPASLAQMSLGQIEALVTQFQRVIEGSLRGRLTGMGVDSNGVQRAITYARQGIPAAPRAQQARQAAAPTTSFEVVNDAGERMTVPESERDDFESNPQGFREVR